MSTSGVLAETVDPASDRAVYKQIADHLRAAIVRERRRQGDQLPSETQVMAHYGVARMTARNALRILQDEGLITAEHGRGVCPPVRRLASDRFAQRHRKAGKAAFIAEADQAAAEPTVDRITVSTAVPPAEVAARLSAAVDDRTVISSRRYLLAGRPVETAVSYIAADLAEDTQPSIHVTELL